MGLAPSTDNYTLGKGVVFFDQLVSGVFTGERDLGNAPSFNFSIALEKLEHFSSRGGLKAKDKEIISQITPSLTFTLDEVNKENLAMLTLGTVSTVSQTGGTAAAESLTVHLNKRAELAFRGITYFILPYDTGTGAFAVGETVTGAAGGAGVVTKIIGTTASGTLYIRRTNTTAFVAGEVLTGGATGAAEAVNAGALGTGNPAITLTDSAGTTFYVEGTDYEILKSMNDDAIGRILFKGLTLVEGATVKATYTYATLTYEKIAAFVNTQVVGKLRFVSDNPAGTQQELMVWSVSLTPSGDTAMIGEDWSTLSYTGEILKDEVNHPDSPYLEIYMDQVIS